ncbi:MAG: type 4a pilus biogenesis protein PilO [bacterium]
MKKKAVFIIILILMSGFISLYYYLFFHSPQKRQLVTIEQEIKKLEYDLKKYEDSIAYLKKEIAELPLEHVNLNYFNRQKLKEADRAPFFLQLINNLANSLGLKLLEISPGKSENKEHYIKTSFDMMLQGDYFKLMRFIWKIENDHKLNIDTLIISEAEIKYNNLAPVNALLRINSIDMIKFEETEIKTLDELRQHYASDHYISFDTEENNNKGPGRIYRNPFLEPSEARYAKEQQRRLEERLKELSVLGIMDFKGKKRALIGNQLFKEGDLLFDQIQVLKIKEDTVILGIHSDEYTLHIEKNPVSLRQNARRRLYEQEID